MSVTNRSKAQKYPAQQELCSGSDEVKKHYDSAGGSHPNLKKPTPRLGGNPQLHEIQ